MLKVVEGNYSFKEEVKNLENYKGKELAKKIEDLIYKWEGTKSVSDEELVSTFLNLRTKYDLVEVDFVKDLSNLLSHITINYVLNEYKDLSTFTEIKLEVLIALKTMR